MKTLETDRLILRDWTEEDIGCEVHNENTIRYLITVKNNYAVVLKESKKIIGTIGLNEDANGDENARNVGLRILERYQNQGLMSEALRAIINNAHLITNILSWFCKTDDKRSEHLAQKFGFKYVKTFYNVQRNPDDSPIDFNYYTLNVKPHG